MSAHRRRGGEHKTATYTITHNSQSSTPIWGKTGDSQGNPELKNRQVAPEDMSRDRTNEFLSICRSMGTNAMQVKTKSPS